MQLLVDVVTLILASSTTQHYTFQRHHLRLLLFTIILIIIIIFAKNIPTSNFLCNNMANSKNHFNSNKILNRSPCIVPNVHPYLMKTSGFHKHTSSHHNRCNGKAAKKDSVFICLYRSPLVLLPICLSINLSYYYYCFLC